MYRVPDIRLMIFRLASVLLLAGLFAACDFASSDEKEYPPERVSVTINGESWYASEQLGGFLSGSPESGWSTHLYFTRRDTLADSIRVSEAVLGLSFGTPLMDERQGQIKSFSLTETMRSRATGFAGSGNVPFFTLAPEGDAPRFTISEQRLTVAEYPYELLLSGSFAADLTLHEEAPPRSALGSALRIEGDVSGVLEQVGPIGLF